MPKPAFSIVVSLMFASCMLASGCGSGSEKKPASEQKTGNLASTTSSPSASASPASTEQIMKVQAEPFTKEAFANEQAFRAKYFGKIVEVEGRVNIASVVFNERGFELKGSNEKPEETGGQRVTCILRPDQIEAGLLVGRGQKVKVLGRVYQGSESFVIMEDCTFTELEPNPITRISVESLASVYAKDPTAAAAKYPTDTAELMVDGIFVGLEDDPDSAIHQSLNVGTAEGVTVFVNGIKKHFTKFKPGEKVTVKLGRPFFKKDRKRLEGRAEHIAKRS